MATPPILERHVRLVSALTAAISVFVLAACALPFSNDALYVPDLLSNPARFNGTMIDVQGAYLNRFNTADAAVLALGVSTQDNGLDAKPLGDPIWLEGFPEAQLRDKLHQPGDAIYGFVDVTGRFETGGSYGPNKAYKHQITVTKANPVEQVRRTEVRVPSSAPQANMQGLVDLADNGGAHNGQPIATQGYYFWNGAINVLAEGISAEEDGSNPQPIGKIIWMEGFPPPVSGQLNVGPGSPPAYVWGKVEVKGQFQAGGSYGKDGAYKTFIQLDPNTPDAAKAIK